MWTGRVCCCCVRRTDGLSLILVRRNTEEWEDRKWTDWRPYWWKMCLKLQPVSDSKPAAHSSITALVNNDNVQRNFGGTSQKCNSILKCCHYCERTHAQRQLCVCKDRMNHKSLSTNCRIFRQSLYINTNNILALTQIATNGGNGCVCF